MGDVDFGTEAVEKVLGYGGLYLSMMMSKDYHRYWYYNHIPTTSKITFQLFCLASNRMGWDGMKYHPRLTTTHNQT